MAANDRPNNTGGRVDKGHDDDRWLDRIAGRSIAAPESRDDAEADRLRRVLVRRGEAAQAHENVERDWERLRFALRRETHQNSGGATAVRRNRYLAIAATVVALAGLGLLAPAWREVFAPDPEVMRGVREEVVRVKDPATEADAVGRELRAAGGEFTIGTREGRVTLLIKLTRPIAPAVRQVLEGRAIALPDQGDLRLVFVPQ